MPRGEEVTRIDASGKTVMPGLIDAHCHTSFGDTRMQEEQDLYTSHELRTLRSAFNVTKVLRSGVTGISDPGGSYFIGVGIREGMAEGLIQGPRMTTAGRFITTSNGISDWYPSSVGVPESSIGVLANTPDEMVTEIRHQVKNRRGPDQDRRQPPRRLRGLLPRRDKGHVRRRSPPQQAHHHARPRLQQRRLGRGRRTRLDHARQHPARRHHRAAGRVEDTAVPRPAAAGATLAEFGPAVGVPTATRDAYAGLLEDTAVSLHKAREAGVTIISGTDTGFAATPYGEWHARELELLVRYAGMTPLEAIKAATHDTAVVLGPGADVGSIEVGKGADVIVVDGDPLADIRVLQDKRRISAVILRGEVQSFDDEALAQRRSYDQAQHICPDVITYDSVYNGAGAAEAAELPDPRDFASDGEKELAAELADRAAAARHE